MPRLILPTILVALLALPASASAAVQIGSDHQGAKVQIGCDTGSACILTQDIVDGDPNTNVARSAGKLTGFRVQGAVGSFRFLVLRAVNGDLTVATQTNDIAGAGAATDITYTLGPGVSVRAGDFIGMQLSGAGEVGARDAQGVGHGLHREGSSRH